MSKSVTDTLDIPKRVAKMQDLLAYLKSGQILPSFTEEYEADLTFAATKALADAANDAVDVESPVTRLAANYQGALLRDAKYAHAGRNHMLKLGAHNAFRELYEGGKMTADNEKIWEEDE